MAPVRFRPRNGRLLNLGSAVAHALYAAGHRVVTHDVSKPAHTRRGMAFVNALYDGKSELSGIFAKRARDLRALEAMIECGRAYLRFPSRSRMYPAFTPDVLVDARMRKHDTPEPQRGLAPLTIGLGPNCEAGETTDVAVETASGHELGHVLWTRRARDLEGEPQEIDGHVRDRYVYAPCSGPFATGHEIGEVVRQGEIVGTVRSASVRAPLSGRLRGLTHAGADVEVSTKIVEVEPRGDMRFVMGLVAAAGGNRRRRSENRSRTLSTDV